MDFQLLQNVKIIADGDFNSDVHGKKGVVVCMSQLPGAADPDISVQMECGTVVEGLLPMELESQKV